MRYLVILVLICILGFLFSALFFMFHDKGDSKRMVKAFVTYALRELRGDDVRADRLKVARQML